MVIIRRYLTYVRHQNGNRCNIFERTFVCMSDTPYVRHHTQCLLSPMFEINCLNFTIFSNILIHITIAIAIIKTCKWISKTLWNHLH